MSLLDAVALCTAANSIAIIAIAYQTLWRNSHREHHKENNDGN